MEGFQIRKDIKIFILVYCISRIFVLFIPASPPDIPYVSMTVESALLTRNLPYPPLFQFQLAVFLFLFGPNLVGYRIGLMIYEVGCLIVLFKFVCLFQRIEFRKTEEEAKKTAIKVLYIFAFFPNSIFNYSGSVEFVAAFLMLLGLYAYYQDKLVYSSIFFCLGFLMEIYPIFCLVPIVIQLLVRKQIKPILVISAVFVGTFVLCNLPFYLLNPVNFFNSYLIQFSRVPNAESLWEIPYNMGLNWNLLSFAGIITISPVGVCFLVWLCTYIACSFVFFWKHEVIFKQQVLAIMLLFMLLLPLVFLSLFPRYVFFSLPIICVLFDNPMDTRKLFLKARDITAIVTITGIATIIGWSSLLFLTIQPGFVIQNPVPYIFLLIGIYLLISIPWVKSSQRIRLRRFSTEEPMIFRYLALSFTLFFVQVLVIWISNSELWSTILMICVFALGILPVFWSIKPVLNKYLKIQGEN